MINLPRLKYNILNTTKKLQKLFEAPRFCMILFHPKGFQGRVFPQWNVLGSGGVSQDSIQLIHLLHLI